MTTATSTITGSNRLPRTPTSWALSSQGSVDWSFALGHRRTQRVWHGGGIFRLSSEQCRRQSETSITEAAVPLTSTPDPTPGTRRGSSVGATIRTTTVLAVVVTA